MVGILHAGKVREWVPPEKLRTIVADFFYLIFILNRYEAINSSTFFFTAALFYTMPGVLFN